MSRWDGKYEAMMELLGAYCLGDEECTDYAWSIFADAIQKPNDPQATCTGPAGNTLIWDSWLMPPKR